MSNEQPDPADDVPADDVPADDIPAVRGDLVPSDDPVAGEQEGEFDIGALLGGGGGGLDMGALLEQATQMQQQISDAQEQAAATEIEGVAGGGAVRITVSGAGQFRSVRIDPSAVDPGDVEMLEDLVLAALTDAAARVSALQAESLGDLGGGLGGLIN